MTRRRPCECDRPSARSSPCPYRRWLSETVLAWNSSCGDQFARGDAVRNLDACRDWSSSMPMCITLVVRRVLPSFSSHIDNAK